MRAFFCDGCGGLVFFENFQCVRCQARLGFAPDIFDLVAMEPLNDTEWRALSKPQIYRRCANDTSHAVCNWLNLADDENPLCISCRCNDIIPDLSVPGNLQLWGKTEIAKRRALYNLIDLGLFPTNENRLKFNFLGGPDVMTGHADGLITLNIAEADDAEREKRRVSMNEPFRTLLGHFRHEIGHFYWEELVQNGRELNGFRNMFGDETINYDDALQRYYATGPAANWQLSFVSAYATAHPWEDWAETWAHYLHIVDTIETAGSFGVSLKPKHPDAKAMTAEPAKVDAPEAPFDRILRHWLPLTYALNTLNRGMGLPDLYPFVLSEKIVAKLRFVHDVIARARR